MEHTNKHANTDTNTRIHNTHNITLQIITHQNVIQSFSSSSSSNNSNSNSNSNSIAMAAAKAKAKLSAAATEENEEWGKGFLQNDV